MIHGATYIQYKWWGKPLSGRLAPAALTQHSMFIVLWFLGLFDENILYFEQFLEPWNGLLLADIQITSIHTGMLMMGELSTPFDYRGFVLSMVVLLLIII